MSADAGLPAVPEIGLDELVDVPTAWSVTASRVLASGWILRYVEDQVQTPTGQSITRQYVKHPGAVGVIALDDQERVYLVRQYRHAVGHRLVEPPAGVLDVDDEDYLVGARRELAEEVGLAADRWHVLVDQFSSPGMSQESIRLYLARGLSPVDAPAGFEREGEEADMDVVRVPLADLVDAVLAGRLHNPTLVSGVLAAWAARSRGWTGLRAPDAPWPARDAALLSKDPSS